MGDSYLAGDISSLFNVNFIYESVETNSNLKLKEFLNLPLIVLILG